MYHKDSPTTIQTMFNHIADRYDLANIILSFSLYKRWNRSFVGRVLGHSSSQQTLVDLCAGTGDVAFDYLRRVKNPSHAYLIDFSSEMLTHARLKAAQFSLQYPSHQISYIEADVQRLPLPDQLADNVTIAYGIRNVQHPVDCMREVFRVLKPGGCFGILELTRPRFALLRLGYRMYLRTLMPLLGKWVTSNKQAYQYLCQSIQTFMTPQELQQLLTENGFINIERHPLIGGVATIFIGHKPKN